MTVLANWLTRHLALDWDASYSQKSFCPLGWWFSFGSMIAMQLLMRRPEMSGLFQLPHKLTYMIIHSWHPALLAVWLSMLNKIQSLHKKVLTAWLNAFVNNVAMMLLIIALFQTQTTTSTVVKMRS